MNTSQQSVTTIIIRGPAASGKSSLAKLLVQKQNNVALIEQDYFNEQVFFHRHGFKEATRDLIKNSVTIAAEYGFRTIVEGIMNLAYYEDMFEQLNSELNGKVLYVYMQATFATTLKRHNERDKSELFGEKELRGWYAKSAPLGRQNELILDESLALEEAVELALKAAKW